MKALFYTIFGATAGITLVGYVAIDSYAEEVTSKSLITKETYKKIVCKQFLWTLKNWKTFASNRYSDETKNMMLQNHADKLLLETLLNG